MAAMKYKWNKKDHPLDYVTALTSYIGTLNEEDRFKEKFKDLVPNQTEDYLERKEMVDDSAEKKAAIK